MMAAAYRPGCAGKQTYGSGRSARADARKIRRNRGGHKMHAYECPFCGRWHLSSMPIPRQDGRDRAETILARERE